MHSREPRVHRTALRALRCASAFRAKGGAFSAPYTAARPAAWRQSSNRAPKGACIPSARRGAAKKSTPAVQPSATSIRSGTNPTSRVAAKCALLNIYRKASAITAICRAVIAVTSGRTVVPNICLQCHYTGIFRKIKSFFQIFHIFPKKIEHTVRRAKVFRRHGGFLLFLTAGMCYTFSR